MSFYNENAPIPRDRCIGSKPWSWLFAGTNGMNYPAVEAPDKTILCPIAFANKSLSNAETCYRNTEQESFDILHGLEYSLHQYHFKESKHNYMSLVLSLLAPIWLQAC